MTSFFVQLIIAVVVLSLALWAISKVRLPDDLGSVLRVVAIAAFLIWLVLRALPLLGVS